VDNFLTQTGAGFGGAVKNTQKEARGVAQNAVQAQNQAQAQIAQQQQAIAESAQQAKQSLQSARDLEQRQIDDRVKAINEKRRIDYNNLVKDIVNQSLPDDIRAQVGSNVYGVDLTQFLRQGSDVVAGQVMTPEQQARINALNSIAGVSDPSYVGPLGSAENLYNFDADSAKKAISSARDAEYQRKVQPLIQQIEAVRGESNPGVNGVGAALAPLAPVPALSWLYGDQNARQREFDEKRQARLRALEQELQTLTNQYYGVGR
jgi:flagellar motility protein MotE (MotC chaperone)